MRFLKAALAALASQTPPAAYRWEVYVEMSAACSTTIKASVLLALTRRGPGQSQKLAGSADFYNELLQDCTPL